MNKENTTTENNKLIAEFMGCKPIYTDHSEYKEDGTMIYDFNGDGTPWIIETWTRPQWYNDEIYKIYGYGAYTMKESMLYHKSWDWLMPVVEKIHQEGYEVLIGRISCQINEMTDRDNPICAMVCGDTTKKIEIVYECIVQFINLYNTNNVK